MNKLLQYSSRAEMLGNHALRRSLTNTGHCLSQLSLSHCGTLSSLLNNLQRVSLRHLLLGNPSWSSLTKSYRLDMTGWR